jgi:hypothetical protein
MVPASRTIVRTVLAAAAGLVTVLGTALYGCVDVGGVSDWERCTSFLGNPILEWRGTWFYVVPLFFGVAVGFTIWWLLGLTPLRAHRQDHRGRQTH